ncbi:FAD-dependent oxidoreductase [Maribellus comscasis]|uniref:FAD-dependent oxidoreductase n=1 Tax=Maribellus comscasis TaxID=2681766 RepID=A0A6I6K2K7_9BACT|nr:FAD-dependent oxidoreductase [Maribellus comscasis]QGY47688.1 FAD-dependent oxidoreductase [Maribellus comscasis]
MDIRSSEPYWLKKNAFEKSYPSLNRSLSTDILIIGGGITGALIAWKLLEAGKEIVLVDRRDVCNGSSAASTAMLQYEIDVPLFKLIEQRGMETAVSSYKNCEKAIFALKKIVDETGSKCDFEFKKSIYFTSRKSDVNMLKEEFSTRKKFGFSVEWLNRNMLNDLGLNARVGIQSESGAIMDPFKLTYDLLKLCAQKGAAIFDKTDIEKVGQKGKKLIAVSSENYTIQANHVIHCTGYESVNTLKKKVVDLKSTYALASESFDPVPPGFKNHIYWDTSSPYLYFRGTSDNRIIIGGGDEPFKNAGVRDALLHKKSDFLSKQFKACFPAIQFKPDYTWAGTFGETKDGLPYLGKPNPAVNEHYVLGFGGNGITYSVMAMDAILDSLNNKEHRFLYDYRFDR